MNKKRLLKDLPFSNLAAGDVLTKANGGYHIDNGESYFSGGGSASNGWCVLSQKESELIDTIWENDKWFENAKLKHVEIQTSETSITLMFDGALDMQQAQSFAKGIQSCLKQFGKEEGSYTWHEFNGFSISFK